mgnify:FL=1
MVSWLFVLRVVVVIIAVVGTLAGSVGAVGAILPAALIALVYVGQPYRLAAPIADDGNISWVNHLRTSTRCAHECA